MGALNALIQAHVDNSVYTATDRQLARRIGISPTALGNWRRGGMTRMPQVENLRRAAEVLEVPYAVVLKAALTDTGYLTEGADGRDRKSAPIDVVASPEGVFLEQAPSTQAGGSESVTTSVERKEAHVDESFVQGDQ